MKLKDTVYIGGGQIWTSGNDGASSGLDADTLDGVQGGSYLRSDADDTYTGTLSVTGTIALGELRIGTHGLHNGYTGLWNTEASTTTTGQYLIISAGTDTYINGDSVFIRGGNNSNSNELKVTTGGSYIGGNLVLHAGNISSYALTSLPSHNHDDRYYTETEVNTLLAGKLGSTAKAADSNLLDGYDSTTLLDATDRKIYTSLSAAGTQAKKYTIGRVYYCPKHWDDT